MKLKAMLSELDILETRGNMDLDISGIQCDSRRVRKGDLFVAIKGEKMDGHDFIEDAVRAGAPAVVCNDLSGQASSISRIQVRDPRGALAVLSANFYGKPTEKLRVVGITGTNGKTTTTYLMAAIFEAAGETSGVIGTLGSRIGNRQLPGLNTTPPANEVQELFSRMLQAKMNSVVMEVSSHGLDQRRVDGIEWDAGVFTNFTQDHLDYHGTMENYFQAKRKFFERLGKGTKAAVAVLNGDDAKWEDLRGALGKNVKSLVYGTGKRTPLPDIRGEVLESSIEGTRFRLMSGEKEIEIRTSLCGAHNVSNCLAAAAVGIAFGIEWRAIQRGIESVRRVPGRLERVGLPEEQPFSVFVDYAHTDDALRNVLKTLRSLVTRPTEKGSGRLIVIFGCGGDRDATKRPLMGKVAGELADLCVITTDNPRSEDPAEIMAQIGRGFGPDKKYEVVLDRRAAIRRGLLAAGEGDVVLLAGKGHETYQEVKGVRMPFDDRQVALEELAALRKDPSFVVPNGGRVWKA